MSSKKFGKLVDLGDNDNDEFVEILQNDKLSYSHNKLKKNQEVMEEYHSGYDPEYYEEQASGSISSKKSRGLASILFGGGISGGSSSGRSRNQASSASGKPKKDIRDLTDKQSELDKAIGAFLTTIEKPWQCYDVSATAIMDGELLKKSRFTSGWKKYYFALNGNNLYYYKYKGAKKPKGIISISFITPPIILSEKNLVDIKSAHVSNYQIQLYSQKRIDQLCALSNEDFEKWNDVFQNLMRTNLETDDYENRLSAWNQVYPLFDKKSELELDRLLLLLAEIDSYSTHLINKAKKEKTGNLLMMEEDDESGKVTWKNYYFALLDKCLYYYKSSKLPPQGVITLKYTDITICNVNESNVNYDLSHSFKLSTPLSVFILKAKHQVAMEDWVNALDFSKSGKKGRDFTSTSPSSSPPSNNFINIFNSNLQVNSSNSDKRTIRSSSSNLSQSLALNQQLYPEQQQQQQQQQQSSSASEDEPQMVVSGYGKKFIPTLTYIVFGHPPTSKPKVAKMSLGSHTIGRSESCTITIDDKKVSRTHCKIEVSDTQCIIMDLGSGHGTKVNKKRIDKYSLIPGDVIKIGKTTLKFEVVKK
ncbi:hypothetical protein DLAC_03242 [Tieghemostelium lacteum]|uniref:Uncharacterized protein n=1 Tax=Tieghemostelium lacteum TaxID=361077 RepID=A0A152A1J3_TIELA|nr:hypothetical protein DLAC_03242 [Tieghemostelium lacteum]|eukprot:KYR00096.1 hypothetical protein DLAC_03242 [Tieghemostelium lacteum]